MEQDEYETIIGKLVLARLYTIQGTVRNMITDTIEEIENQYLNDKADGKL